MKRTTGFNGISYSTKTRQSLNVGQFKGVDYTTPSFEVSTNRALDMLNFIRYGEVLEKRKGLTHFLSIDNEINNILFVFGYFGIYTQGTLILFDNNGNVVKKYEDIGLPYIKLRTFERNGKVYILSGIYYYYLSSDLELHKVEEIAEIPTTTIGILPNNLDSVSDENRATLSDFNLLTPYHINQFTCLFDIPSSEDFLTFELDSNFTPSDSDDLSKAYLQIDYIGEQGYYTNLYLTYTPQSGEAPYSYSTENAVLVVGNKNIIQLKITNDNNATIDMGELSLETTDSNLSLLTSEPKVNYNLGSNNIIKDTKFVLKNTIKDIYKDYSINFLKENYLNYLDQLFYFSSKGTEIAISIRPTGIICFMITNPKGIYGMVDIEYENGKNYFRYKEQVVSYSSHYYNLSRTDTYENAFINWNGREFFKHCFTSKELYDNYKFFYIIPKHVIQKIYDKWLSNNKKGIEETLSMNTSNFYPCMVFGE